MIPENHPPYWKKRAMPHHRQVSTNSNLKLLAILKKDQNDKVGKGHQPKLMPVL
jgi:hypothetical protein